MNVKDLLALFGNDDKTRAAIEKISRLQSAESLYLDGLQGSASAVLLSAVSIFGNSNGIFLAILNDKDEAGYFYNDLISLCGDANVMFFPSPYRRDVKYAQVDAGNEILRTNVLSRLSLLRGNNEGLSFEHINKGSALDSKPNDNVFNIRKSEQNPRSNAEKCNAPLFVVTYPEALSVKVVNSGKLNRNMLSLRVGDNYDLPSIEKSLLEIGFRRKDYVYEAGDFAVRGSILDVFSYTCEYPYRIDFFGDEVDSIRTFDVDRKSVV